MFLSKINQRRWQNFKANRRAYWSLVLFLGIFLLSFGAEIIANDKPLVVKYKGEILFPFIQTYTDEYFDGDFATEADYKDPFIVQKIMQNGWMVMPVIPYSFNSVDYDLDKPTPTPPSSQHWLGTDDEGRDIVARILYGIRLSVVFSVVLTFFASVIGIVIGAVQGYFGGKIDFQNAKNGIIHIDDAGTGYDILWGLEDGAKPTSEIPTHLMNHIARMKATDGACRVIYHAHPANITALTYTLPPEAKAYTRVLWQSETECAVVFPEGVGVVDWMVPGSIDIGIETAKLITKYRAVVWTFHGIFGSGVDFDETFGLVHTIEKAAEIYLKAKSAGIVRTITDDEFKALADAFGVTLNPEFLG